MKLTFDIKYDHVWHLFFSAQCCWIPAYPKPNPRRTARELKKLVHHNGCTVQLPTLEKSEFIVDMLFKDLESDDCVYAMMRYCRKHFNSMQFRAQLTLQDTNDDPLWEFPMAYWNWNESRWFSEYPEFSHTYISPAEAEVLLKYTPEDAMYTVALGILECRAKKIKQGTHRFTLTSSLENDWDESIFERFGKT